MHFITEKVLRAFWTKRPDAMEELSALAKVLKRAKWSRWSEVQRALPKASYFKCCLVFNGCGGKYRLIVKRTEDWKRLYVVGVLTHAEYDLDEWKKFCDCP